MPSVPEVKYAKPARAAVMMLVFAMYCKMTRGYWHAMCWSCEMIDELRGSRAKNELGVVHVPE